MEHLHVHALKLVANTAGSPNAQHFLCQRYLHGKSRNNNCRVLVLLSIVCSMLYVSICWIGFSRLWLVQSVTLNMGHFLLFRFWLNTSVHVWCMGFGKQKLSCQQIFLRFVIHVQFLKYFISELTEVSFSKRIELSEAQNQNHIGKLRQLVYRYYLRSNALSSKFYYV